jgi:hypothetical protein
MIARLAKYSDRAVFLSTLGFVAIGAAITVLWQDRGMFGWLVCLSCTTLPVIHYLCRELVRLRQRVQDLEQHRS